MSTYSTYVFMFPLSNLHFSKFWIIDASSWSILVFTSDYHRLIFIEEAPRKWLSSLFLHYVDFSIFHNAIVRIYYVGEFSLVWTILVLSRPFFNRFLYLLYTPSAWWTTLLLCRSLQISWAFIEIFT